MSDFELKVCRYVLAVIWLVTAALSFGLYPIPDSLVLVQNLRLPREVALLIVYAGASLDVAMGVLTLALPGRVLWSAQMIVIGFYTLLASLLAPEFWLHPFGPLLKNFALLTLLWLLYRHAELQRRVA